MKSKFLFAMFTILCLTIVPGYATSVDMVWGTINDPGVSGHEGFNGQMSKYETTNAQYCQFLNAALASGDITVSNNNVIGASGSNGGVDFAGEVYYNLMGGGYTVNGAINGGAARINYTGSSFTIDSGFENHPVTYVSWYGATAFCNYYGYRLPTEWEWQAVADYDGSFAYGCGTSINNSIANYIDSIHPDGTTIVGAFGTYGYGMCDMTGNVWEWTSTVSGDYRILRGLSWYDFGNLTVSQYHDHYPAGNSGNNVGFRVCRSVPEPAVTVNIDIKPGSYPNAVNLGSQGLTPVAILSEIGFDARTVNPATVNLAGALVAMRGKDKYMAHAEDVNKDGLVDLVVQVVTCDIDPGKLQQDGDVIYAVLTGSTVDGITIEGEDEITIVPGEK